MLAKNLLALAGLLLMGNLASAQVTQATTRAPQPTTRAPQPTTRAPQPTTRAPQPTTRAPQPTTRAPQPTTRAPQPTTRAPQPTTRAPQLTTRAPQPATAAPQPTTRAPQPTSAAVPVDVTGMELVGISESQSSSKKFYYNSTGSTWYAARDFCNSRGMKLATIDNEADGQVMDQWYSRLNSYTSFWLGGTDQGGPEWKWIDSGRHLPMLGESYQEWYPNPMFPYTKESDHDSQCLFMILASSTSCYWYAHLCAFNEIPPMCMLEVAK